MSEGRLLQYASEREHGRRSTAADGARTARHERDLSLIRASTAARSKVRRGSAALLRAAGRGLGWPRAAAAGE